MTDPKTLGEYVAALPKAARVVIGVLLLPVVCLVLVMSIRELITRNSKTFQDTAGLLIVYCLSVGGPILALLAPRLKILLWLPVFLAGALQFLFIAIGKPIDEWWLIATIAPFTVGTPVASLLLYKYWFASRFGL